MSNPYIIDRRVSSMGDVLYIHREFRRYEAAARRFREAGIIPYAEMFDGFAEQARLEIEALAQVDQRIAALDAKLAGAA